MKINESEFEELQFYKRKLIVSFKLSFLFLLLFFPTFYFMFHMEKKYVILLYIYNLLVLLAVILINKKYDLAKYYLLHMINFSLIGSVVFFIFGFFLSNIYSFNWNTYINIIIISFFLMSCPFGIAYGVKNWVKKLNIFRKTGVIDKENNMINFYIIAKNKGGLVSGNKVWGIVIYIWIAFYIVYLGLSSFVNISITEYKFFAIKIGGIGFLALGMYLIISSGSYIGNYIILKKFEKQNNIVLRTSYYKYFKLENKINEWRVQKGLEPIKIRDLFFSGKIDS